MTFLLIRPTPLPDETLAGYIHRLAKANHYPNVKWITDVMGTTRDARTLNGALDTSKLIPLSTITGVPVDRLWKMTLVGRFGLPAASESLDGAGQPRALVRFDMTKSSTRVCPDCLRHGEYLRLPWLLRGITVCVNHNVMLIDACVCGKRLTHPTIFFGCQCGRKAQNLPTQTLLPDDIGLRAVRYIHRLFGLDVAGLDEYPLNEMSSDEALLLLDCFRRWMTWLILDETSPYSPRNENVALQRRLKSAPPEIEFQLYAAAFQSLTDWPHQFYSYLERERELPRATRHNSGVVADFTRIIRLMSRYLPQERYQFLYEAFHKYLASSWTGGYVGKVKNMPLDLVTVAKQRWIGLYEAAEILGVNYQRVLDLVDEQVLQVKDLRDTGDRRYQVLIDRAHCQELAQQWSNLLSTSEASQALDITEPLFRKLIQHGLLPLPKVPKYKVEVRIDASAVQGFLESIRDCCSPGEEGRRHWVSLTSRPASLVYLLTGVLAKRIAVRVRDGGVGLSAFEVNRVDIRSARNMERQAETGITLKEMATQTGIPLVLLRAASEAGLIRVSRANRGNYVDTSDVEAFRRTYVDFAQAKVILGTTDITAKRWLRKRILAPVLSTDRRFRKHLFRRDAIERVKLEGMGNLENGTREDFPVDNHQPFPRGSGVVRSVEPDATMATLEICKYLGVSAAWIRKQVRAGRLSPVPHPELYGSISARKSRTFWYRLGDVQKLVDASKLLPKASRRSTDTRPGIAAVEGDPGSALTAEEAARRLGVSVTWLRTMAGLGKVRCYHKPWPSRTLIFYERDLAALQPRNETLTAGQAAKLLGVSSVTLNRWRRTGQLIPVEGPEINGQGRYRYRRVDIETLLTQKGNR